MASLTGRRCLSLDTCTGPLNELALKRIRRAFPLLDTSVMGNAGVQPVVPHIEQHVSLPLFNLEAEQSHDCPAHTLRHLFSSEAHDLNRSQRYPSPTTTTTTARGFTHCLLTLLNLPSPLVLPTSTLSICCVQIGRWLSNLLPLAQ
jgi:hypothetical protein